MRKCLKAGFIISIVLAAVLPLVGIGLLVGAAFVGDEAVRKSMVESGIKCLVWTGFFIFDAIVDSIVMKKVDAKQVTIAHGVLAIITGVCSNVFGIPAGILMIINRDKINQQ